MFVNVVKYSVSVLIYYFSVETKLMRKRTPPPSPRDFLHSFIHFSTSELSMMCESPLHGSCNYVVNEFERLFPDYPCNSELADLPVLFTQVKALLPVL